MNLLFVEDDEDKAEKIASELSYVRPDISLMRARSFDGALRKIVGCKDSISGVILDMSMPNYDNSSEAPENFAGRDFLRQCKLRRLQKPTVVVTMLDLFGTPPTQLTIQQLDAELAAEFEPSYLGIVYYSSAQDAWKAQLKNLLKGMRQ